MSILWILALMPVVARGLSGVAVTPNSTNIFITSIETTTATTNTTDSESTITTPKNISASRNPSSEVPETESTIETPLCQFVNCSTPREVENGTYTVGYERDCTPYLTVSCNEGYTETNELYYCIDEEWFPPIVETLCEANCGPLNIQPNMKVFYTANYSLVPNTNQAFPSGTEVIFQCREDYLVESLDGTPSLSYSSCRDGEWTGDVSLICAAVVSMACEDQQATVITLSVLCGLQTLVIVLLCIWVFSRCIRKRVKVPKPAKESNAYTTPDDVPRPPPAVTSRSRPPRPPARTDTAVVSTDSGAYYSYADVKAEKNGNHIVPKSRQEDSDGNGEESNPAYLDIIS